LEDTLLRKINKQEMWWFLITCNVIIFRENRKTDIHNIYVRNSIP